MSESEAGNTSTPTLESFTPFLRAFCNPTRVAIVDRLLSGEACVCDLTAALNLSQPLISHHLAVLRAANLVHRRDAGTRTYYSIDWHLLDKHTQTFSAFVAERRATPPSPALPCM